MFDRRPRRHRPDPSGPDRRSRTGPPRGPRGWPPQPHHRGPTGAGGQAAAEDRSGRSKTGPDACTEGGGAATGPRGRARASSARPGGGAGCLPGRPCRRRAAGRRGHRPAAGLPGRRAPPGLPHPRPGRGPGRGRRRCGRGGAGRAGRTLVSHPRRRRRAPAGGPSPPLPDAAAPAPTPTPTPTPNKVANAGRPGAAGGQVQRGATVPAAASPLPPLTGPAAPLRLPGRTRTGMVATPVAPRPVLAPATDTDEPILRLPGAPMARPELRPIESGTGACVRVTWCAPSVAPATPPTATSAPGAGSRCTPTSPLPDPGARPSLLPAGAGGTASCAGGRPSDRGPTR